MNFPEIFGVMKLAAQQVIILYLMVAVGFVTDKTRLFTEKAALMCTDLLFYIITPAKIIESFLTLEYSSDTLKNLFIAIGMGLLMHAIAAVISTLSFRRCDKENLFHKIYSIIMFYTIKLSFCRVDCIWGGVFPLYRLATRKWRI